MELSKKWSGSSITPGTVFMDKIRKQLMNYCRQLADKKKIKIIFSGSNTPGEGEHKIFKFIRENYYKNYMIYGLDADLIFLSIASNKKNIFLLREANQFDKKQEGFNIVKMDIFKYLIIEIFTIEYQSQLRNMNTVLNINYEKILNDFVCIYFLLGNDFIPHIPSLHIYHNGSDLLIKHYVTVQLKTKQYIVTDSKHINEIMLFQLLNQMSINENDNLNQIRMNEKKKGIPRHITDPYEREMYKINNLLFQYEDPVQIGKENYKQRYYDHYKIDNIQNMVSEYIKSISWIQQYYFCDNPSWTYYYPYHVAPFISDIIKCFNSSVLNFRFKPSKPYYPFEQLSMVLHPYNFYLLPKTIKEYYSLQTNKMHPTRFNIDYLYKTKYFKTIPLIPNIDVQFIKDSVYKFKHSFNIYEKNRNKHYNEFVF
jgi:5'-3' exonuclease